MRKTLAHLFIPRSSNNYKAKTLHVSSLSVFILIIMISQVLLSFIGQTIPGVLGVISTITAEEIIDLTNQKRQENNLPELKLNPVLVEAAQQKGADMMVKNYWAHTAPDGKAPWYFFKNVSYQYLYAGENLARDFIDSPSVVNAWMNSPTHKDNILSSRYQEIGIAVIQDTFQGSESVLVVQLFGTQMPGTAPAKTGMIDTGIRTSLDPDIIAMQPQIAGLRDRLPLLSSFQVTKAMSISLTFILLTVVLIDTFIITKKKIIRLSGKGLAHLVFLGMLLIILIITQQGIIL